MAKVIVIGAGICGLGTALLLARDGHEVTVLERDREPPPDTAEQAWTRWARKGVAQFHQPHNFMPRLRLMLEEDLPDVQEALVRAGAARFDLAHPLPAPLGDDSPRTIDGTLWTYTARRPVGEWVFAQVSENEPRITMRRGVRVVELVQSKSAVPGVPHVAGVRTDGGEVMFADLTVDASGRGSRSPSWLAALGAAAVHEEEADSGFAYHTRYFRGEQPARRAPPLTPLGSISVLTLPGDNETWSLTIFHAANDRPLRNLRHADPWTRVIEKCPLHAHWLEGEPITDVVSMGGVVDRYRRFVVDGVPIATGFVAVADAWACTNPSAGRGLTVGMVQAARLRDVLREGDDPADVVARFDAVTEADIAPWYYAQIAVDRARFAEMQAIAEHRQSPPPDDVLARKCIGLLKAMIGDPDIYRGALEYIATLTPVQALFDRPGFAEKVAAVHEAMHASPPPAIPGPDRRALLELAA
jgi:2-polyprenyl-6-methoxyphenol hydroxylase-like FAD-dependent oxidoreductase